jgi:hypothetical protein
MTGLEGELRGQIELYQGNPIERIPNEKLTLREKLGAETLFLASDVTVGQYGQLGFVVIDTKPEKRYLGYFDGEDIGRTYETEGEMLSIQYPDPNRQSHFLNTNIGFKMIRYFVLPPSVSDFFAREKNIGDAYIQKCLAEDSIPDDFDEVRANPFHVFGPYEAEMQGKSLIKAVLDRVNQGGNLKEKFDPSRMFGRHCYASFFPWQVQVPVLEQARISILEGVSKLDHIISVLDNNNALAKRDLEPEPSNLPAIRGY